MNKEIKVVLAIKGERALYLFKREYDDFAEVEFVVGWVIGKPAIGDSVSGWASGKYFGILEDALDYLKSEQKNFFKKRFTAVLFYGIISLEVKKYVQSESKIDGNHYFSGEEGEGQIMRDSRDPIAAAVIGSGFSFVCAWQIVLIVAKLYGLIAWSWLVVLWPLIATAEAFVISLIMTLIYLWVIRSGDKK